MIRPAALALFIFYWSLSAQAQAPDNIVVPSADLVQSAVRAFERHDYPVALSLFKRASVSHPGVTVRLYLARSRAAMGQLVGAAADYSSVVAGASAVEADPSERQAIADARDELAQLRPRIPSIEIALGDAELRSRNLRLVMDGRLIAFSVPIAVDPGHHEVIASDAEGEQSRLVFDIGEGEAKTVGMTWLSETDRANKKHEQVSAGSSARRTWGVVALTVGATGLGLGTVTGIASMTRYSRAEAHCPANRCTEGGPFPEDGSAFRTLRTISAAGYIVGGVGIGTWLGLLLTTPKVTTEQPKVSPWTPVVGMGSAGARYAF
ncbi:MAG: hypothetical protein WDO74_22920 [Pseudomonadota bacterium]